jgi:Na+-driven multidrug efflux pump
LTIEYTDTVSAKNLAAANFVGLMCIPAAIAFFAGAWPSNKRFVIPKRVVVVIVVLFLLAIGIDSAIPPDELSAYALGIVVIWVIFVSRFTIAAAIVCANMRQGRWSKAGLRKPT